MPRCAMALIHKFFLVYSMGLIVVSKQYEKSASSRVGRWSGEGSKDGPGMEVARRKMSTISHSSASDILYHFNQFVSHASRGPPKRRNVTVVTENFVR